MLVAHHEIGGVGVPNLVAIERLGHVAGCYQTSIAVGHLGLYGGASSKSNTAPHIARVEV